MEVCSTTNITGPAKLQRLNLPAGLIADQSSNSWWTTLVPVCRPLGNSQKDCHFRLRNVSPLPWNNGIPEKFTPYRYELQDHRAMAQTRTRSLQQIKSEVEQTRTELTATVSQLRASLTDTASEIRERVSPTAIRAEVSDYIKMRGEHLVGDVTAAFRKNPFRTVAIGAGTAYPVLWLMRSIRSIPAPILMIGAGLFLAGSKGGQSVIRKTSEMVSDVSDRVRDGAQQLGRQAAESVSSMQALASDQTGASGYSDQTADVFRRTATDRSNMSSISEADQRLGVSGTETFEDRASRTVAANISGNVQDRASGVVSAADKAASTAADAVRAARESAANMANNAGETVVKTIGQNPLIVAGAGLILGGLIASSLPRTELEENLIGRASQDLKRRAQAAASGALDAAKNVVGEAYESASEQAKGPGPQQGGEDLEQSLRHVSEHKVTTAFEPEESNHQPNTRGEADHG